METAVRQCESGWGNARLGEYGKYKGVGIVAENLAQSVDGSLNRQSRALFEALHAATGKFSMFGHQNETSNVITPDTDSDVHAVTGAYPAVWGNDSGAAGTGAYGTPLPESPYARDFNAFARNSFIRMADSLPRMYTR